MIDRFASKGGRRGVSDRLWTRLRRLVAIGVCVSLLTAAAPDPAPWVCIDARTGRLSYRTTPMGDRIMDFSFAGYRGGGVALPNAAPDSSVLPSGGDDSGLIQAAIDRAAVQAATDGRPRAVILGEGTFHLADSLRSKGGTVLRGDGAGRTILSLTGAPHVGIAIGGHVTTTNLAAPIAVTDSYVPSGTAIVHSADAAAFRAGDRVRISAPVTAAWLRHMGMDRLSRDGKAEVWLDGSLDAVRTVAAIRGDAIVLSTPLSHSYDMRYLGAAAVHVTKIGQAGVMREIGIEDLSIVAPPRRVTLDQPHFTGLSVDGAEDFWVRDVAVAEMTNDVEIGRDASRGTFENVDMAHSQRIVGAAKPFGFSITGTQILIDRCHIRGDAMWYVATNRDVQGPNVVLDSRFDGDGAIEPHQRWATGLLVDGVTLPGGGIAFQNRGEMGSGHGWTVGWSVSWRNDAAWFLIQNPPGSLNWSIGDTGEQRRAPMPTYPRNPPGPDEPSGIIERPNAPVAPKSLYRAQLAERLGPTALLPIGYVR